MRLLIVSASQRTNSQSVRVGEYINQVAGIFDSVNHIELCRQDLPMWDGDDDTLTETIPAWPAIDLQLQQADAYVLITPEWSGMASPILKNFLMICKPHSTGHKPVVLVSVVSGISGAYPLAELRMNAFKNNKMVEIPESIIVRNVEQLLESKSASDELKPADVLLRDRIDYSLISLHQYAHALANVRMIKRDQPFNNEQRFKYGM
jgi:NAD(P)H-dependent FMN reductase